MFVNVFTQNGYDAVLHDLRLVQYLGALVEAPDGINGEISHRAALRTTRLFKTAAEQHHGSNRHSREAIASVDVEEVRKEITRLASAVGIDTFVEQATVTATDEFADRHAELVAQAEPLDNIDQEERVVEALVSLNPRVRPRDNEDEEEPASQRRCTNVSAGDSVTSAAAAAGVATAWGIAVTDHLQQSDLDQLPELEEATFLTGADRWEALLNEDGLSSPPPKPLLARTHSRGAVESAE